MTDTIQWARSWSIRSVIGFLLLPTILGYGWFVTIADAYGFRYRSRANKSMDKSQHRSGLGPPVLDRFRSSLFTGSGRLAQSKGRGSQFHYMWEDRSEGMFSLEATAVELHPTDPKVLYAGADGILYRSSNGGNSWRAIARFRGAGRALLRQVNVDVQVDRLREQILEEKLEDLAAEVGEQRAEELRDSLEKEAEEEAEERVQNLQRRRGRATGSGRFRRTIHRIEIPPSQPNWVGVATDAGFFLSRDQGKTFKHVYRGRAPGEGDIRVIRVDPKNAKKIWLGTKVGLWFTLDGGKSWRREGGNLRTFEVREIRYDPAKPSRMFVATNRSIFLSRDGGQRFIRLWTLVSGTERITGLALLSGSKPRLVVATGNGLFVSRDMQSFERLPAGGIGSRQLKYVTTLPQLPQWIFTINDQGVFVSRNQGRRFEQYREGMLTPDIRWIAVRSQDPSEIWAATDFGLLRWSKVDVGRFSPGQWRNFQKRLRLEPTPWQMAQAAMRAMNLPNQSLGRLSTRQKARGWLPEVRVQATLALDNDPTSLLLVRGQRPISILEGRAFYFELILNWQLGQIILPNQQVEFTTDTRTIQQTRQRLINRIIRLYHARRRLLLQWVMARPTSLRKYMKSMLRIQEISAYLDALTGGYLRRRLKRHGQLQTPWGSP